jgi:hypothetical protein
MPCPVSRSNSHPSFRHKFVLKPCFSIWIADMRRKSFTGVTHSATTGAGNLAWRNDALGLRCGMTIVVSLHRGANFSNLLVSTYLILKIDRRKGIIKKNDQKRPRNRKKDIIIKKTSKNDQGTENLGLLYICQSIVYAHNDRNASFRV